MLPLFPLSPQQHKDGLWRRFRFGSMARLAPNGVNLIRMLQLVGRIAVHLFALLLSSRTDSGTDRGRTGVGQGERTVGQIDTTLNWDWDWD